jgi:antitoxin (DNA-binding transcriptional repressor) of toxin-antitoxin stability system
MQTIPLEQADGHLAEIIARLSPDEEVVLTRDDKPIATIKATPPPPSRKLRKLGTLKGTVLGVDYPASHGRVRRTAIHAPATPQRPL